MLGDEAQELVDYSEDELADMDKERLKAEIAILEGSQLLASVSDRGRKDPKRQGRFQCLRGVSTTRKRVQGTFK
jgi:hypothetical protein